MASPLDADAIDALRDSADETILNLIATVDEHVRLIRWFTSLRIHDMADALHAHGDPDAAALLERIAFHGDDEVEKP